MKFRNLKKRVATFGVVSVLSVLCLSFQNCSRPNFKLDDVTKEKVLGETPVFGDEHDPGTDPSAVGGRDPGVDPVTGMPRDPGVDPVTGMPHHPGTDPVTGMPRDPGVDPVTGMPHHPGTDPVTGMPRDPGVDPVTGMPHHPGTDPVTGMPRNPGTDPNVPKPPKTPRDPGIDTGGDGKTIAKFEFSCPDKVHIDYKTFVDVGEVKAVVVSEYTGSKADKVCEIPDVREQIIAKRQVDITSCYDKSAFRTYVYVVEKSVTSNYKKFNLALGNFAFVAFNPIQIIYAAFDDKANAAGCDQRGDPLVVQLNNDGKPQPISLSSADRGVMFDLLGQKNNYEKVQTAWFTDTKTENYFLVLPDAKGEVKGIDQLFGDNTVGPDASHAFAKQGFEALAKHDDNQDDVISADDSVFESLRLWKDDNLDGIAQPNELYTLDQKGVVAIDIKIDRKERKYLRTDSNGNQTKYRSVVFMRDGHYGLVYDLWLRYNIK